MPVIANNYKGGISEIILKNINGEIIDITDHIQLEKALQKKYNSEEIKKSILRKKFSFYVRLILYVYLTRYNID